MDPKAHGIIFFTISFQKYEHLPQVQLDPDPDLVQRIMEPLQISCLAFSLRRLSHAIDIPWHFLFTTLILPRPRPRVGVPVKNQELQ